MAEKKLTKEEYYNMEFNVGKRSWAEKLKLKKMARTMGEFCLSSGFLVVVGLNICNGIMACKALK